MKKLILAVMVATITGISPLAVASSDETGCSWSDYCSMGGVPYLDVDNDTRINLLMLAAGMRNLPVTFSALPLDVSRSRGYTFGVFAGEAQPETGQAPLADQTAAPKDDPLDALALSLGIKPSGLTEVATENEGRWVSNNSDSLSRFFQALLADQQLDKAERDLLALRRAKIYRGEAQEVQFLSSMENYAEGSHAAAFRDYLTSAQRFYDGQFVDADTGFLRLKDSDQKWVAETSAYMQFRVALNQITENATDQYGMFDPLKANKDAGDQALQRAQAYLAAYPDGQYVNSVQGLLRRVNLYLSDWPRMAQLYETEIVAASDINTLGAMINEADQILLSRYISSTREEQPFISTRDSPLLTFTQTMKWLRKYNLDNQEMPKVTDEILQGYKPMFVAASQLPLWEYMHQAWLFYQQKDYAAVTAAIQPAAQLSANDLIAFSQQILYGDALAMQGNWQAAEAHWRHLLGLKLSPYQQQYLQLMLTIALVHENQVAAIFAPDSPITNLRYRSLVLKSLANKALLQQQAAGAPNDEEKTIALHTLLFNDLMVGDYQGFIDDGQLKKHIKQTPEPQVFGDVAINVFDWHGRDTEPGYYCASLADNVAVLAKNKTDPHAMNCLGEFFRATFADISTEAEMWGNEQLDEQARTELNKDRAHGRLKYYQQVIADPKAEPEDKSYALYRAVMCFSPSGYNSCDRQEIPQKTRQRWFNLLKSQYKGNPWEQKLKYYW